MDPLTLAFLASTAISAGGSLLGANAASKNTKQQAVVGADATAAQRENMAQQAMFRNQDLARIGQGQAESMPMLNAVWAKALQDQNDARAGMTTAAGSRVYFDPQRGWVTSLGPQDEREQAARAAESTQAASFLDQLKNLKDTDPNRLRDVLYARAASGLEDGFRAARSAGMQGAVRTGNDRLGGAILTDLGKAQGKALSDAALDAEIKAPDIARARDDSARNTLAQLYQAFAGSAGKESNVNKYVAPFAGMAGDANRTGAQIGLNVAGTPLQTALTAAGVGQQGGANVNAAAKNLASAFNTQGLLTQPDDAMAKSLVQIGALGSGASNLMYNRNAYDQSYATADRLNAESRRTGIY
jgi:hypothetical protein